MTRSFDDDPERRLAALRERYGLGSEAMQRLRALFDLLVDDPSAPSTIRAPLAVLNDHLADSLIALDYEPLRTANEVLDLGAGAGLPGLPLAIALERARFTLLEASLRKCRFLEHAVAVCQIANAEVVHDRAESLESGLARYDVVTARALASLPVTMEYAAPLLRRGGTLLIWRGRRDADLEAGGAFAARELGLSEPVVRPVTPYPGAQHRHLYAVTKLGETPAKFPRRPGMALKRPLGGRNAGGGPSSDRAQR